MGNSRFLSGRMLFLLAAVLLVAAAGIYFLVENSSPRTYQDSTLSLTYPPTWKTVEPARMMECTQQPEGRRCQVVLVRAPDYLTKIIVIQQAVPAGTTLEQVDNDFWNRLNARVDATLERAEPGTLDGKPTILRQYGFQFEGGSGYEMSISLLDGQTLYQIFANAEDRDVLLKDLPEIQNILYSIRFQSGDTAQEQ
jgi:hypothetical protein